MYAILEKPLNLANEINKIVLNRNKMFHPAGLQSSVG